MGSLRTPRPGGLLVTIVDRLNAALAEETRAAGKIEGTRRVSALCPTTRLRGASTSRLPFRNERLLRRSAAVDLSRCRGWRGGSHLVDPDVMDAFADAGAGHGLRPGAMYAGYGMAEAPVAVS